MSRRVLFLSIVGALVLGGCATIPQPLAGDYAPVTLDAARSGTANATQVRWGGEIVETQPQEQQTCFFVLAESLDSQARPKAGEESLGRFVACKQGFYDPEVFAKGREITVTGTLATRLIWTLLTDPTSIVAAIGSGSLRVLAAALFGAQ